MHPFTSGMIVGTTLALVVSIIGLVFFKNESTSWIDFGKGLRTFARGVLGVVSITLILVGAFTAVLSGSASGWQLYFGFLLTYAVGLFLYFTIRYNLC